jgi:CheY-like chemotaxis protein/anti-sigma regulatory factor (Ser/Thr protein kinase)
LIIHIDKNIPKYLIGDDQRISQVITNLLSNAVKFTPENGSITLDTKLLSEKNNVCTIQISVTDTGIGISKEHLVTLFESFQQAESSTARTYGGTGLGLSISKSFVEMMGGEIWVESEVGKGSTFAFTIQVKRCEETDEHPQKDSIENTDSDSGHNNDFTGHRVLIAEDMEINREIIIMLLESTNLEIDCAENGKQAVDMFIDEPDRYELILMDVHMPGMDGYEATAKIRLHEQYLKSFSPLYKPIPIVAMTANVFKEDIDKSIKAGMDAHLGKPLDLEMVLEKLRHYLFKY